MGTVTGMGVFVLATKFGLCILAVIGVSSTLSWYSKKSFSFKKGGSLIDNPDDEGEKPYSRR